MYIISQNGATKTKDELHQSVLLGRVLAKTLKLSDRFMAKGGGSNQGSEIGGEGSRAKMG